MAALSSHSLVENNIVNLSKNFTLTEAQISLLSRGLSFIPSVNHLSRDDLEFDLQCFHRRLKLAAYFEGTRESVPLPFLPPSLWEPASLVLPEVINRLIIRNNRTFKSNFRFYKEKNNLSIEELSALKLLQNNKDIVIKPADKGSAVVIMDRSMYINEALRQLNNPDHYKALDAPIYPESYPILKDILTSLLDKKLINIKQFRFLLGDKKPSERKFYLLPKIHKDPASWFPPSVMPPGRPIVSDCGSDTDRISDYIEHFLNPISIKHPAYIKDTYHFISIVKNLSIPPDAFLFSLDVDSLYTNIDTKSGLAAVQKLFFKYPNSIRPDRDLLKLLELNLTRNDFVFDKKYYLQVKGTAMGKSFAPSYANIFMAVWEETALANCPITPLHYYRFLDDIWGIWTASMDQFSQFISFLNGVDPSIKLKFEISENSINFLDTTVYKGPEFLTQNRLEIKVFFKPTDTHALLYKNSFHPKHTFNGIVKSQLLRFSRICTCQSDFQEAVRILFKALRSRGYARCFLRKCFSTFRIQKIKDDKEMIPFISTFSTTSVKINGLIKFNYNRLIPNSGCLSNFKIISAHRKNKNLKDLLVRAKLPNIELGLKTTVRHNCASFFQHLTFVRNPVSRLLIRLTQKIDPSDRNCIYLLFCDRCGKQYVGETRNSILTRLWQHRHNARHNLELDTPLMKHVQTHDWSAIKVAGLQCNNNWSDKERKMQERKWIFLLNSRHPHGLNKQIRSSL